MLFSELAKTWPDYAKDQRLNVSSLLAEQLLTDQQKWGTFVAAAHAVGVGPVIKAVEADALAAGLSLEAMTAAKAAAAIMAMNNVYYRALHLLSSPEYRTLPARLRMNVLANPGVEKVDFELWSTAVSAVNGCGMCLDAHETELKKHGVSAPQVQAALRIAAVINALSRVVAAEQSLAD